MNPTLLLAIATLALVIGPLLDRAAKRLPLIPALIDGATVGGIVVVSLLHLMPEAGAHLGWWALAFLAVGLVLPVVAERLLESSGASLRVPIGVLVVLLLLAHEVIESAALASKANEERVGIATLLVVVGHRLPLGLILWGQTKQRFGRAWSVVALALVASVTWFGPLLVPVEAGTFSAALSALLAGGLLHLVLQHGPSTEHDHAGERMRNFGAALGTVIVVALFVPYLVQGEFSHGHTHDTSQLPARFRELVLETSVPLLLGVLGAAAIEAWMPGSMTRWLARGSRLRRALVGVAVGAPVPVCSCGVLPIYRSLIKKGVGATAALALLISAPEIGVDSILLSWTMLGPETTIARVASALALALIVALVVGTLAERGSASSAIVSGPEHDEPRPRVTLATLRRALLETWGHLSPWILFGLVLTALAEPWISTEWARSTPAWMQVVLLSLAGLPTYVCATAATPFAALLLAKDFAPGAVVAFLLTGPATNFTTFGALRRMHSTKVAIAFAATALVASCALGLAVDALLPVHVVAPPAAEAHTHGWPAWSAAAVLVALTLWVLFREGPRRYLAQLWNADPDAPHAH